MKRKSSILVALQIIAMICILFVDGSFGYNFYYYPRPYNFFQSIVQMTKTFKAVVTGPSWILYLGYLLVAVIILSSALCIVDLRKNESNKVTKVVNCLPFVVSILMIVVGKSHELVLDGRWHVPLEIHSLGYIGIFLLLVSVIVAFLPISTFDNVESLSVVNGVKEKLETKKESTITSDSEYEKIASLKKMLDEGLISEEEYNEKRKSILSRL